jgi:hypothetical protein
MKYHPFFALKPRPAETEIKSIPHDTTGMYMIFLQYKQTMLFKTA